MEIFAPIFFTLLFGLGIFISKRGSPKWKYIIRKNSKYLPNADQGYWEVDGPIGQKLRFTDDALDVASKRYLSNEGDGVQFVDAKFSPKNKS